MNYKSHFWLELFSTRRFFAPKVIKKQYEIDYDIIETIGGHRAGATVRARARTRTRAGAGARARARAGVRVRARVGGRVRAMVRVGARV